VGLENRAQFIAPFGVLPLIRGGQSSDRPAFLDHNGSGGPLTRRRCQLVGGNPPPAGLGFCNFPEPEAGCG
jgi:hypothetical protein